MGLLVDLTGQTFGKLKVLYRDAKEPTKHGDSAKWRCLCTCGKEYTVTSNNLRNKKRPTTQCDQCSYRERKAIETIHFERDGCHITGKNIKTINRTLYEVICKCETQTWVLRKDILNTNKKLLCRNCLKIGKDVTKKNLKPSHFIYNYLMTIKRRAIAKQIPFDDNITAELVYDIFLQQECRCALSGEPLTLVEKRYCHQSTEQTGSLDRIVGEKGYTVDNIQWIHKMVNQMKSDYPQEHFLSVCRNISELNPNTPVYDHRWLW